MEGYEKIKEQMLPCPFCGGTDIRYSVTVAHTMCYCNTCHCYGPRVIVRTIYKRRTDKEKDEALKTEAIRLWNKRE